MGTWQSAINVHCCTLKRDGDDDSDGEREDDASKEASALCVARSPPPAAPPSLDERSADSLPRSVSHATTVPVGLMR